MRNQRPIPQVVRDAKAQIRGCHDSVKRAQEASKAETLRADMAEASLRSMTIDLRKWRERAERAEAELASLRRCDGGHG